MKYLLLVLAAGLLACNETVPPVVCDTKATPAIQVFIRDSVTGQPFTAQVTTVAREGSYSDSLTIGNPYQMGEIGLAHDRPGTYTVSVRAFNYAEWQASNVAVSKAVCGVNTVHLVAKMQKDVSTSFSVNFNGRGEFSDASLVRVRLTAGAFSLNIDTHDMWPKRFVIPTSGTATVRFSLVTASNDTLGSGQTSFTLEPAYDYGVLGFVGSAPPAGVCIGPAVRAVLKSPTNAPVTDTLFIILGGLPKGAIC